VSGNAEINVLNDIVSSTCTPMHYSSLVIIDTSTMGHYLLLDSACVEKRIATKPIHVMLPDGSAIQSSHEALLPFPQLLQAALQAHIFLDLRGQALLSMGTFCDAGCTAIFDATSVKITYQGNVVLEGTRVPPGLWKTQVLGTKPSAWQGEANGVFTTQIRTNTIKFLHAACFSPTMQTWTLAIFTLFWI
jgi:hypothetical protein